jgi:hypothetical protein
MSTTAASGSGEPPERRGYGSDKTLPRSGLLEQRHRAEAPISVVLLRWHPGGAPLMPNVSGHSIRAVA